VTEFTCTYIVYEYLYTNELIRWRSGQLIAPYTAILPSLSVCSWVYGHLSMCVCTCMCTFVHISLDPTHKSLGMWLCACVCMCVPMCMDVFVCVFVGTIDWENFSVEVVTLSRPTVKI